MAAYTVSQLESLLGSYVEPSGNFTTALAQVLPRIYNLGMWRDLTFEDSFAASNGYISLPHDAESVISCTVDNLPRPARSMWTDVRFAGRNPILSPYFGIVDDGLHPVMLDMKEVQGVDSEEDVGAVAGDLSGFYEGTTSDMNAEDMAGAVTIRVNATGEGEGLLTSNETGPLVFLKSEDYTRILNISYENVAVPFDLVDQTYPDKVIATIPAGSGVLRFRRFRTTKIPDSVVHLLMKRACPAFLTEDTVIHLGNINAIKHALLGRIAEDASDLQRAEIHWATCEKLLDDELDCFRGSAKPLLVVNGWGVENSSLYNIL